MKKWILWTLTSLLIALTPTASSAQVAPDSSFTVVDSGTVVSDSALVIDLGGGRALLGTLDSLRSLSEGLKRQVSYRDSLINNLEAQLDLCEASRAQKDTLLKYERGVREAQRNLITELREAQPSTLEKALGYSSAFGLGAAVGQGVCVVN